MFGTLEGIVTPLNNLGLKVKKEIIVGKSSPPLFLFLPLLGEGLIYISDDYIQCYKMIS